MTSDNHKQLSGNYNSMKKEIETINKNQEGIKNTISEIKNTLEGITSKLNEAEDRISELEDKVERNTQVDQLHEKRLKKYKDSLRELQNNMKCNKSWIIGIQERKEKAQERENLFQKNNDRKLT